MSKNLKEYHGALKYAFSKVMGVENPKDWEFVKEEKSKAGKTILEFKNTQSDMLLIVTSHGYDADAGGHKFSVDADGGPMNLTIPDNWKNLKV